MERLPGHQLPPLERKDLHSDPEDLACARNVHQQLTDVIFQLASLKFNRIGSLREDPSENFFRWTVCRLKWNSLSGTQSSSVYGSKQSPQGPFFICLGLVQCHGRAEPKVCSARSGGRENRDITVAEYELLAELSNKIIVKEFGSGPFVIHHNDLTVQSILVDDEFNITGILNFPGTIVPLASLCVFPWLFSDNIAGLVPDRDAYLDVFLNRECRELSSALQSCELRKELMQSAHECQSFELGLLGPYTSLVLPKLFEQIHNRPFDFDAEYQRVAHTQE